MLERAIKLNRSVLDVETTLRVLAQTFNEQPDVVAALIGLTPAELRVRLGSDDAKRIVVCDECFTTPHQISCSRASG